MLVRTLYISQVFPSVTSTDIERLVAAARRRNRQLDLTGALMACDGHFAQVLEGREESVNEVMGHIAQDPRHHSLRVVMNESVTRRLFSDWDMAFVDAEYCEGSVHALLNGETTVQAFLAKMAGWVEESRSAPG